MPMGKVTVVHDFLPPPDQLVPAEETVKITIAMDRPSLNFFKKMAAKFGSKYQRMIREVLKRYAEAYELKK